jgi:hypothetical protein
MIIDRVNYPGLHAAITEIELDNGAHHVNRIAAGQGLPEPIDLDHFTVPEAWAHLVEGAERGLARLLEQSQDEFETFLCGEESDQDAIKDSRGDLSEAHILLNDWFNGFPTEDTPFSSPLTSNKLGGE